MGKIELPVISVEDAKKILEKYILKKSETTYSNYGYDVYLFNVIHCYLAKRLKNNSTAERNIEPHVKDYSTVFMDAAWKLCLEGVLRPGTKRLGNQSTDQGDAGGGFCILDTSVLQGE